MDTLYAALTYAAVAPVVAERGGAGIAQRLTDARDELLACNYENAAHPEVAATAENRTLLCGIAITLVRSANAAARVAARRLGQPAIAEAFKLTHLRSRAGSGATADEPADDEPTTEPVTPADPTTSAA